METDYNKVYYDGTTVVGSFLIVKAAATQRTAGTTGGYGKIPVVELATTANDKIVGVTHAGGLAVSNRPQTIASGEKVTCIAGVALSYGDKVTTNASSQAIVAAVGNNVLGIVRQGFAAIGEQVEIEIQLSKA
jgi:hypothetical protein